MLPRSTGTWSRRHDVRRKPLRDTLPPSKKCEGNCVWAQYRGSAAGAAIRGDASELSGQYAPPPLTSDAGSSCQISTRRSTRRCTRYTAPSAVNVSTLVRMSTSAPLLQYCGKRRAIASTRGCTLSRPPFFQFDPPTSCMWIAKKSGRCCAITAARRSSQIGRRVAQSS